MATVTLRGTGGAVWDQDVPEAGSNARTQWDKDVAAGRLTIVGGDATEADAGEGTDVKVGEPAPVSDQAPVVIPDDVVRTIDGLTGWVNEGDTDEAKTARAAAVLELEQAQPEPRVTLLGHLRKALGLNDDDTPATPATPEA